MEDKMKKLMVMMMVGMLGVSSVAIQPARAEGTLSLLADYGIPCALALGLSAVAVKNDGAAIGAAICVGVASATYLNKKTVSDAKLKEDVDKAVADRDMKISDDVDAKLAKMEEKQDASIEESRKIMREILAERLTAMDTEIRADMEKQMSSGDFYPMLQKKIDEKIKEDVIVEGRARSREVIGQCVDDVIRQVTAHPVGVQETGGQNQQQ
jgi:hypothetical protein